MDWSKIKTIFIITFLILDVFLGYQFVQKRNSNQIDVALEMSIEDLLHADNITYIELPDKEIKENYISGRRKKFTEEELRKLQNQNIVLVDDTVIKATLKKPETLPESNTKFRLKEFIQNNILYGNQYIYWDYDKKTKSYYYYQQYNDKTIYNNYSAMLIIRLNEKNQIVSYEQTLLNEIEEYKRKEDIIPAIKALEILYKKDFLKQGSHVSKVELGYYGLFLFSTSKSYVLTPTWRIVVDDKEDYYVNALEGQVIEEYQ